MLPPLHSPRGTLRILVDGTSAPEANREPQSYGSSPPLPRASGHEGPQDRRVAEGFSRVNLSHNTTEAGGEGQRPVRFEQHRELPGNIIRIQTKDPLTTSDRANDSSRWILFTLWLLVFGSASQVMILAPILPRISEELGVSVAALGTLATTYAVSLGLFALVTGPISDRIGRRRILLAGALLLTLALALHAIAHSFVSLLLVRGLAGAGGGVLSGAAVAFVGDYFPSNRRGWANSWIMSGIAAGQIAGIPLGSLLAGRLGFQAPFLLFAAIMAMATMLVWKVIPQLAIADLSEPASVRAALRGYLALLRRPTVVVASVAFLLIFLSISLYMMYLPVWLEASLGFTGLTVALVFLVGGVSNVLAGPRAGRLSDDVGRKPVIIGASSGLAAVMLATPLAAL